MATELNRATFAEWPTSATTHAPVPDTLLWAGTLEAGGRCAEPFVARIVRRNDGTLAVLDGAGLDRTHEVRGDSWLRLVERLLGPR